MPRLPRLPVLLLLATACSPAAADELLVFAAASTSDAMAEVGRAFERSAGHHVACNFAASSTLARQLLAGARADLFLSADAEKMDQVERAGLVARADRRDLLSNQLVVVVPARGVPTGDYKLARPDPLRTAKRIALADPAAVPAGLYARAWLEKRGLWREVEPKVVPTLDVRAALAAAAAGRVDAAIVYRTDALNAPDVRIAYVAPPEESPRIVYPAAPLARAPHAQAARALARFLAGPEARAIFARFGFIVL
jgi:molybdate transport system substrate-binding protein